MLAVPYIFCIKATPKTAALPLKEPCTKAPVSVLSFTKIFARPQIEIKHIVVTIAQ